MEELAIMSVSYKKLAIATIAALSLQMGAYAGEKSHGATWSYEEGDLGPANWGSLSENYAMCDAGKQQSPVNISDASTIKAELPSLELDYKPVVFDIVNNGHTIRITPDNAGTLTIGDDSYQLWQFHFHAPSEEAINGKHSDMVMHIVHRNAENQFAVIAVLMEKGETANPLIDTLWKVMSKTPCKPQAHDIEIDINQLLPEDKNYYTLWGSVTTPPCFEGVRWIILKQPITISAEQLTEFQEAYFHNNRPIQPLNNRWVLSSD
jgi:carbonic anhydrase